MRLRRGEEYCDVELDGLTLVKQSGSADLPPGTTRSFFSSLEEAEEARDAWVAAKMAQGFVPVGGPASAHLGADVVSASPNLFDCEPSAEAVLSARFIMDHSVRQGAAPELAAFLQHPSTDELAELRIGVVPSIKHRYPKDEEKQYGPLVATLVEHAKPSLHSLSLIEEFDGDEACFTSLSGIVLGDVSQLYGACPDLTYLSLRANNRLELGVIDLSELQHLRIETDDGFSASMLRSVAQLRCPSLERLELHFGYTQHSPEELAVLFDATFPESLTDLQLSKMISTASIAGLARARVLPQLQTLGLRSGDLDEAGAEALTAVAGAFTHLQEIDLEGNAVFSNTKREALERALPHVSFGMQISF